MARDPRDVLKSTMNHQANTDIETERALAAEMGSYQTVSDLLGESNEERFNEWLNRGLFECERDRYPYWSELHHGETFWRHRNEKNILVLPYADMKRDLGREMRKIAAHSDIEIDEKIFCELVEAASFDTMNAQADSLVPWVDAKLWKSNAQFFAKGKNDQWKDLWSQANVVPCEALCATYTSAYTNWLLSMAD